MAVDSSIALAEIICRHRLLTSAQAAEVKGSLSTQFAQPRALAGELIRRGWLTPYQINQIFLGRGRELLLESYVLLERLGEGGMGQVFKARNWKMNRLVALKVIRKDRLSNPNAVRRFEREVRAAAQLNHPNVVHAYDCGEADDRHFYVMEYIEGIDLARLVQRDGPLPVEQACEDIRQAALGLQHAFEHGLVHRDIKPHNLLRTRRGDGQTLVKILDLGLARVEHPEDNDSSIALTREGAVLGTLDYIAPEQARNAHAADTRADVYSLGCTLYFLLAGRPPFSGGTATEKLLKHQLEWPTPIQELRTDVSESVAQLIERALAKRPEQRFQTPAEMAVALAAALSGATVPRAAARPAAPSVVTPPPVPVPAEEQALEETSDNWSSILDGELEKKPSPALRRRRTARRRAVLFPAIIAVLSLLAMGLLLWLLLRGS